MKVLSGLVATALAASLSGCISAATLMKLKADGSGTIEQKILMNTQAMEAMMQSMAGAMGGQVKAGAPKTAKELLSEAELKAAAARMGKGVRFVSSQRVTEGAMDGVAALYAFDDVNTVRIDENPPTPGAGPAPTARRKPVAFNYVKQGTGGVLTIHMPDEPRPAARSTGAAAPAQMNPQMLAMMQKMFEGMHIVIDVEVDGTIVKTNADYVTGSRVTLVELDMGDLMKDPKQFEKLQGLGPGASFSDVKPLLKDVKGVKLNGPTVSIEFAPRF